MYKILVLDDNRDLLEAVSFSLNRSGKMKVIAINDPSLLLLYLEEHKPDILLMDISMGRYDGRELCSQIKQTEGKKNSIPVVLFTANKYSVESIEACKADAFIEKPFPIQRLYAVLEKFLPSEKQAD